ncbi:MAG: hypothetical protein WCP06_02355 [Verrucomicrobiota bacterium]
MHGFAQVNLGLRVVNWLLRERRTEARASTWAMSQQGWYGAAPLALKVAFHN